MAYLEDQNEVLVIFYLSRYKLNTFAYRCRCNLSMWLVLKISSLFS